VIRFHQTFGAHAGRVTEVKKDKITFGRMPSCDIAFDPQADLDASGQHAEVLRQADGWHVVDAGSRNGTWLNGQKVQRAVLSSGDELEFGMGGPRVKVEILDQPVAASHRQITGPMTPTPNATRPDPRTPVPRGLGAVDASAATVAAMATPVPVTPTPGNSAFEPPTNAATPNALGVARSAPGQPTPVAGGVGPAPMGSSPGSSPKQYGERTVGLMIQAAIAQQGSAPPPKHRSTDEIRAIAAQSAPGAGSSSGLKIVIAILVFLLLLVLVGGGIALYYLTRADNGATTSSSGDVDLQAVALSISAQNGNAVHVLIEVEGATERGICAAFSVRPDLLATSAQCVLTMQEGRGRRATHFAVPNGGGGQRMSINQMWHHPGYVAGGGAPSADVGIVQIVGTVGVQLPLASMAELAELEVGDPLFVFGFTGDLANVTAPAAAVASGRVTAIAAFDGPEATLPTAQVILHDARGSAGTRGSPVFDAFGRVIAIEEGGHAVRIDLLASLLAGMGR
jgi:hypothetical protein